MTSRPDRPAAIVMVAGRLMPEGDAHWGRAMTGELHHVHGRGERWRFAMGCLVTALFLPSRHRGLLGLLLGLAAADLAVLGWAPVQVPGLTTGVGAWMAFVCTGAVVLSYAVVGSALLRRAPATQTSLRRSAAPGGLLIALAPLGLGAATAFGGDSGPGSLVVLVGSAVVCLVLGAHGASRDGSIAAAGHSVCLSAIVAGLGCFLLWATEAVALDGRPYEAGLLRDFRASGAPDLAAYAVADSLGSAMVLLLLVPMLTVAVGLIGATAAGLLRGRSPS